MNPTESTSRAVVLADLAATSRLAQSLSAQARAGDAIGLSGGLGLGKTTFARAFIRARPGGEGIEEVPSPTFTLVQVYELPDAPVWHFDLYRIRAPEEVWELGLEQALAEGIALIEWPERAGSYLPAARLDIAFAAGAAPESRRVALLARSAGARDDWPRRLDAALARFERVDA